MQKTIAAISVAAVICVAMTDSTFAQRQAGDTASHRRIPLPKTAAAPSIDDFVPKELMDEYNRRSAKSRRRWRNSNDPQADRNVQRQLDMMNDQKWVLPPISKDEFAEQLESVSRQIGESLTKPLAETFRPGSIKFDPDDTANLDRFEQLRRTVVEGQRQFDEANKLFREIQKSWPSDSVAPEEWLDKVQPFINSEVIEQLSEAARQFESQQHLDPSERRFQNIEGIPELTSGTKDASKSIFDSIMTSIDKQGTNWIKSSDKEKSSLWKSLRQSAQKGIKSLNQKMSDNSMRQAGATEDRPRGVRVGSEQRTTPTTGQNSATPNTPAPTSPLPENNSWIWIFGVAMVAIAIVGYFVIARRGDLTLGGNALNDRSLAEKIHDRDSLLAACHALARNLFGIKSCFWNHRKLFSSLSERSDNRQHVVSQLSSIYEQARYAPKVLLEAEFARARELFLSLQRGLQTEA